MKTKFLLVFALAWQMAIAQSSLEVNYGWRHYQRQDLTFSPLIFRGTAPLNLGLGFQKASERAIFDAKLQVAGFSARSTPAFDYTTWDDDSPTTVPPSSFWLIGLDAGYQRRLDKTGGRMDWYFGGAVQGQLAGLFYEFGEYGAFGYTTVVSLSPMATGIRQLGEKNSLRFCASLPLLNWVARSPYAINDDEFIERQSSHKSFQTLMRLSADGELASLGSLQGFRASANFQRKMGERWTASLGYQFALLRSQHPQPMTAIENAVCLGFARRF